MNDRRKVVSDPDPVRGRVAEAFGQPGRLIVVVAALGLIVTACSSKPSPTNQQRFLHNIRADDPYGSPVADLQFAKWLCRQLNFDPRKARFTQIVDNSGVYGEYGGSPIAAIDAVSYLCPEFRRFTVP